VTRVSAASVSVHAHLTISSAARTVRFVLFSCDEWVVPFLEFRSQVGRNMKPVGPGRPKGSKEITHAHRHSTVPPLRPVCHDTTAFRSSALPRVALAPRNSGVARPSRTAHRPVHCRGVSYRANESVPSFAASLSPLAAAACSLSTPAGCCVRV
jgi:hypothetical protein